MAADAPQNDNQSTDTIIPVRRALLSVSDKAGVVDLAKRLAAQSIALVSTGGTAKLLREAGLEVDDVSHLTNFPEMMDGRVKTLHPGVHGGLLALRDNDEHVAAMAGHNIAPIDLLVVNLYPFEATVASGADFETCVENIDIGGPAMIRAAAKNYGFVGVVTDPSDYETVCAQIESDGGLNSETRKRLAAAAYGRTAAYDAAISRWYAAQNGDLFPKRFVSAGTLKNELRYGENPHQRAAFYSAPEFGPGFGDIEQVQGKALSYNNLNDTDAALALTRDLPADVPSAVIVKHANPCGVASGTSLINAYELALRCDPVSAFGGIISLNQNIDGPTAEKITEIFTEVVIAPSASDEAKAVFAKKKNLRLLLTGELFEAQPNGLLLKPIAGGLLVQNQDTGMIRADELKTVTKRAPSAQELEDLLFAFRVAKHVKSNAIVYVKDGATVGIGAGQMSRLDSSRIAARKSIDAAQAAGIAEPLAKGSVVASDAFFPFADGLLAAAEAGATAIIQPGGSMRDDEVIAAADEAGFGHGVYGHAPFSPLRRLKTYHKKARHLGRAFLLSWALILGLAHNVGSGSY